MVGAHECDYEHCEYECDTIMNIDFCEQDAAALDGRRRARVVRTDMAAASVNDSHSH